jgi:hypothetical protein
MPSEDKTHENMKKVSKFYIIISFGDVIFAQMLSSLIDGLVHAKTRYLDSAKSCQ